MRISLIQINDIIKYGWILKTINISINLWTSSSQCLVGLNLHSKFGFFPGTKCPFPFFNLCLDSKHLTGKWDSLRGLCLQIGLNPEEESRHESLDEEESRHESLDEENLRHESLEEEDLRHESFEEEVLRHESLEEEEHSSLFSLCLLHFFSGLCFQTGSQATHFLCGLCVNVGGLVGCKRWPPWILKSCPWTGKWWISWVEAIIKQNW